jgi:hypothetical protein
MEQSNEHSDGTRVPDTEAAAPAAGSAPALVISHAEMNDAFAAGTATPFTPAITWLARYADRWWIVYERGWLCITDQLAAADIDQRAALISTSPEPGHRLDTAAPAAPQPVPERQTQGEGSCPQPRS